MRDGIERAMRALNVSQRRACRGIGRARSTHRYVPRKACTDRSLVDAMLAIARQRPRFGYRRIAGLLRRDGWRVGRDRVRRLCRGCTGLAWRAGACGGAGLEARRTARSA